MKALGTALVAVLLMAAVGVPTGEMRVATTADLAPHPHGKTGYTETWTYHLLLDGGTRVFVNFSRANLGAFKGEVSGADLSIIGLGGRDYAVAREFAAANLKFVADDARLSVHRDIWFQGRLPRAHHVHYETAKKGISYLVDLEFSDIGPGRVWGDGVFTFRPGERLGVFIHIPFARVTGTVAVNETRVEVSGTAYMDHMFETTRLPRLLCRGHRYIHHGDGGDWEVGNIMLAAPRHDGAAIGYALRKEQGTVALLKPGAVAIEAAPSRRKGCAAMARTTEVEFLSGARLRIERLGVDQRRSVLDGLGLLKPLARLFLGGEIILIRGPGRLDGARPAYLNDFVVR